MECDGVAPGIGAEDGRLAGGGAGEPEQDADGGGLPRAVRAEEAVDLAGFDVEVEAVEGGDLSVALDETLGVDDGSHARERTLISRICEYLSRRHSCTLYTEACTDGHPVRLVVVFMYTLREVDREGGADASQ